MSFREATISLSVIIYVCSLSYIKQNYRLENPIPSDVSSKLNYVVKNYGWLITAISFLFMQPTNSRTLAFGLTSIYTSNWLFWTRFFNCVHLQTQACRQNGTVVEKTKVECITRGLEWYDGFDISGHTFLLTFAIILIHSNLRQSETRNDIFIRVSRTLSCIYLMYCVFMLSVTALYYHTLPQKAIAVFIAVSSFWALKFVFRKIKVKPITAINESKRTD